jgi:hypothetical protein
MSVSVLLIVLVVTTEYFNKNSASEGELEYVIQ